MIFKLILLFLLALWPEVYGFISHGAGFRGFVQPSSGSPLKVSRGRLQTVLQYYLNDRESKPEVMPDIGPPHPGKKLLVLDLDET